MSGPPPFSNFEFQFTIFLSKINFKFNNFLEVFITEIYIVDNNQILEKNESSNLFDNPS